MSETAKPNTDAAPDEAAPDLGKQGIKLAFEMGPLLVFFVANSYSGIFWATGLFMIATVISLGLSRHVLGKIPIMPLVSGVFVLVFGALTLYLQDELFIKVKPTIVNVLFGSILLGCLAANQLVWRILFGDAFQLDEQGWRKLQFRWGVFFLFLAILNEFIWRNFSTDFWAGFKLWGVMPITMLFAISLIPVMQAHEIGRKTDDETPDGAATKSKA